MTGKPFFSLRLFSCAVILPLCACQTLPDVPRETLIPVPVACIKADQIPPKVFLPDSELAKLDDYQLVIQLRQDQLAQRIWITKADALLTACQ